MSTASRHLPEDHRSQRSPWLRATVLGANDGVVSIASLLIGVAAADSSRAAIMTAGIAGLVAGAMSMGAGEYVSVSTQRDIERADLELERQALAEDPEEELAELAAIYEERGCEPDLARRVATQLMAHDDLGAHARDEIGITEVAAARPLLAATASALAFTAGAFFPLLAAAVVGTSARIAVTAIVALVALALIGAIGARAGGAPIGRAAARVLAWGGAAMLLTYVIGRIVGAAV